MKHQNAMGITIIFITILTVALLYLCDQVLTLSYNAKIVIKLILFTCGPFLYIRKADYNFFKESIYNVRKINDLKVSLIFGVLVIIIIAMAYITVKQYIDIDTLIHEFENKYKINKQNIIYYGLYITFINSLLEEAFFRGFIFLNLKKLGFKKWAYIVSSLAFSVYHIANFQNWFSWQVFLLACTGLFIGGTIFNYLDDKPNTFLNSWFVHICADLAIILIGFRIFEII
ncbi:MAG: CPBP family intramembrane metalloprotease [Clostridia bacterium]|nr:CPBP family intramembrane metalloprotease [Clostridia bacterium]